MIYETLVICHFLGDYALQTDHENKIEHVLVYSVPFIIASIFIPITIWWLVFNAAAHYAVDFITRKYIRWKYIIGLDQLAHYLILFTSYKYLCT